MTTRCIQYCTYVPVYSHVASALLFESCKRRLLGAVREPFFFFFFFFFTRRLFPEPVSIFEPGLCIFWLVRQKPTGPTRFETPTMPPSGDYRDALEFG